MSELRILLVEDSRADAELTKLALGDIGAVEHCQTLAAALARLADPTQSSPSVVLLDLSLPDGHGIAILERLARANPPPVLVMSGDDDPKCARDALERGACGYVVKGSASAADLPRLVREAAGGEAGRARERVHRILVVEDSLGDAVLVSRALEGGEGPSFALTVAGSLREAIESLAQGFDAILLDLTLPESAGVESVVRMRAAARDVPIVVLSGMEGDSVVGDCIRAGARAYLSKGRLDPIALRRTLNDEIARRRTTF